MKTLKSALFWSLVSVVALLISTIVIIGITEYPTRLYASNNGRHPLAVDCQSLKPGMELESAMAMLSQHGEPSLQSLDGNQVRVERGGGACVMELDTTTGRLLKIEARAPSKVWDIRVTGN